MRHLCAGLAALALAAPPAQGQAQSWRELLDASAPRALPARVATALAGDCARARPDSLFLVRPDSANAADPGTLALLGPDGRWHQVAAPLPSDTFAARVVGMLCGERERDGVKPGDLVLEREGRFVRYAPPSRPAVLAAGVERYPLLRLAWGRNGRIPIDYSARLRWLGSARILRDAGEWSDEQVAAALQHRVLLGMNNWMVFVSLGRPVRSNLTVWSGVSAEEWTYANGSVDFREGKASAIRLH